MKNGAKKKKKGKARSRITATEILVYDLPEGKGLCMKCKERAAQVELVISPVYEKAVHAARPDLVKCTHLCLICHDLAVPELVKGFNSPRKLLGDGK